jgi:hypothetical protein
MDTMDTKETYIVIPLVSLVSFVVIQRRNSELKIYVRASRGRRVTGRVTFERSPGEESMYRLTC